MPGKKTYVPVFRQLIFEVEKGFLLLKKTSREEIIAFIKGQQHENGSFSDRAGNPDLYYSLFGALLSKALKQKDLLMALEAYISSIKPGSEKIIDKFSLLLICLVLEGKDSEKPTAYKLFRWAFKSGGGLNPAYRFFLFALSFDALYGRNSFVLFILKIAIKLCHLPRNAPCSFYAALLLTKFMTGQKVKKETSILLGYFEGKKGFKIFHEVEKPDLLSSAVALFALKNVGADLRPVSPDCLNLVQENYDNGAFLSGNGDSLRDLEYTFYGLLILGAVS